MFDIFFQKATELNAHGQPFAMAIVVRSEPPISGKPGDKAIIQPDGSVYGWIGGGCTQPVILREARKALADGQPRLVRITPTESMSLENGVMEYAMTCHSGGALDIYIEPVPPKVQLLIVGKSVVARTLARLGHVLDYRVLVAAPEAEADDFPGADHVHPHADLGPFVLTDQTYVVVSTQGEDDEALLTAVLAHDLPYVAFVASRKKAAAVFANLGERGVPKARLAGVKVPAGLDIHARTSEEIAVSILAEIIQVMRGREPRPIAEVPTEAHTETLHIGEMTCAHCVHTVQTTLEKLGGVTVHEAEIGTATISFDPATVARPAIVAALAGRGYPVHEMVAVAVTSGPPKPEPT